MYSSNLKESVELIRRPGSESVEPEPEKDNRAGWPGCHCVELDAVTSQPGATDAEAAIWLG